MKLVVCVNHAQPYHTGGSEKVVQQITESMSNDFGLECHVLTKFCAGSTEYNGVNIHKANMTTSKFLDQIRDISPDYLFTYSDYFQHWKPIVLKSKYIKARKGISMVGMNAMTADLELRNVFKKTHKNFDVVTHSASYVDYDFCVTNHIPVNVIHNAIDMNEFSDQGFSFREKYGIHNDKKIILCVSNFFPGKGQDHLFYILEQLSKERDDFIAVFIAKTVSFNVANNIMTRFGRMLNRAKFKYKFLKNITRSEVIQAFLDSDIFAFPSQQEVSPLVLLEAMAAKCPWVSLPVGNVNMLKGGITIPASSRIQSMYQYSPSIYKSFTKSIRRLLDDNDYRLRLANEGNKFVNKYHNWETVKYDYHNLFTKNIK